MIALRHHFRGVAPHSVLLHGWSLMSNSTCTQCVIPLQTNHFEALKILPFSVFFTFVIHDSVNNFLNCITDDTRFNATYENTLFE